MNMILNYRNWERRLAAMAPPLRRRVAALAVIGAAAAALFGSMPSARAQSVAVDEAARALLPDAIKKSGTLRVGLEINFAPWMYQDGDKAEGIDPDFMRIIAAKLGVKFDYTFAAFPALLPGIQGGRFDLAANFTNTAERRKVVSFVNYITYTGGMLVLKGNPHKVSVKDLCGFRVSSGVGSFQQTNEQKLSELCVKAGKPAITIVPLQQAEALAALRADRVDAADVNMAMNAYLATLPGSEGLEALEGAPPIAMDANVIGYITNKEADGVAISKAVAAAFNAMIKSGDYAANLEKWKLPDEAAVKEVTVN
jgi:polar amino acid transport system substrate-binding protein